MTRGCNSHSASQHWVRATPFCSPLGTALFGKLFYHLNKQKNTSKWRQFLSWVCTLIVVNICALTASPFPLSLSVPNLYLRPKMLFSNTKAHFWPCLFIMVESWSINWFSPAQLTAPRNLWLITLCILDLHSPRPEFSSKFGDLQLLQLSFETSACFCVDFFLLSLTLHLFLLSKICFSFVFTPQQR